MLFEKKFGQLIVRAYENHQLMSEEAAKDASSYIIEKLKTKKVLNIVFGAAPFQYEFLAALAVSEGIDWSRINAFHMDEYIGLPDDAPQSSGHFLKEAIFSKVPFRSVYYMNGFNLSPSTTCEKYTQLLLKNPIDIVIMGIGENGRLAFNDPHVALFNDLKMVKVVKMDETSRQQQAMDGSFASKDLVPTYAISLSIPALMSAIKIFCLASGNKMTNAVNTTLLGEVKAHCPASILRTHPSATLYCDKYSATSIY